MYDNRGSIKTLFEDYRGAISDFTKAIELNPKYATAYYNRGISKLTLQDINGGCLDLSKAGELGLEKAYEKIKEKCK